MADRRAIEDLKAPRSGYKAAITRNANRVTEIINNADPREDATLIQAEIEIKQWKDALDRYVAAEDAVMGPERSQRCPWRCLQS